MKPDLREVLILLLRAAYLIAADHRDKDLMEEIGTKIVRLEEHEEKASPKLVEALRRLLTYVGDACESSQRAHTEESCSVCNARDALAGLED